MKLKAMVLSAVMTLASSAAFAGPADVLLAVLNDKGVQDQANAFDGGARISKAEVVGVFRCPGCFQVEVTMESDHMTRVLDVTTMAARGAMSTIIVQSIKQK